MAKSKKYSYLENELKSNIRAAKSKLTRDKKRGIATGSHLYDNIRQGIREAEKAIQSGDYDSIAYARQNLFRANQDKFVRGEAGTPIKASTIRKYRAASARLNRQNMMYDRQFDNANYIAGGVDTKSSVKKQKAMFKDNKYVVGDLVLDSETAIKRRTDMLKAVSNNFAFKKNKRALNMQANALSAAQEKNDPELYNRIKKMSLKTVVRLSTTSDFFERVFTEYKNESNVDMEMDGYFSADVADTDDIPF